MRKTTICAALWCLAWGSVAIAEQDPGAHALLGVRLVIAPGEVIDKGTLVIRDGIIEAVGADVELPPDARIWERDDLTLYAGWIEPYSVAPWPSLDEGDKSPQGGHVNPLVTPERDMTSYAFDEGRGRKLREAGFTTALVAPKDGLIRGQSVLLNLGQGTLQDNLLQRHVAQHLALSTTADDDYPSSVMGSLALTRQTLHDARWYAAAQAAYVRQPAQRRPPFDVALDALVDLVEGRQRVIFESEDMLGTLRSARLADEFSLDGWFVGSGDEYKRLEDIAATSKSLLLPLSFPDAPEVADEDDLRVDIEALRHWDAAPDNPRHLLAAGVTVAFTTHGLADPKEIHRHLTAAVERGLETDAALAALTTTPARMLGMAERLGTLEVGKMANLMVVEGELFVDKPKIREVWVDGRRYEVKASKPPEVNPVGSWDVVIDAGEGGKFPVQLVIQGELGNLSGTIGSSAGAVPLTSAEVSGKALEVVFDSTPFGLPGSIQFKLNIEGESASGSGMSPQGPFRLKGQRTSQSDPEVER